MDGVGSVDSYIWRCAKKCFGFFSFFSYRFSFPCFFFVELSLFTSLSQFSIKRALLSSSSPALLVWSDLVWLRWFSFPLF